MDFADRIRVHAKRVADLKELTKTEEATKTSLILPFLQALGYDAFDPRVVVPEFTADVGTKKGERVDYAIKRVDEIIMLIEAKSVGDPLDASKATQLHRYFHGVQSAKIAVLTDGVVYKFYTDLEKTNIMDDTPFMIFNFSALEEALIPELKKLCNDCFDVEIALLAAQDLKYLNQIKKIIAEEMKNPSDELVKLLAKQVYSKPLFTNMLEMFKGHVRTSFQHTINDIITARLQGAIQTNAYPEPQNPPSSQNNEENSAENSRENRIATSEEEIEGHMIVRAILREVVEPSRVVMRDTISYCGILLDDNNRKPICRLHFNSPTVKHLETMDADKNGTKHKIDSLNDLYQYADELKKVVQSYDRTNS